MRMVEEKVYVKLLQEASDLESEEGVASFLDRVRQAYSLKHVNLTLTGIGFSDVVSVLGTLSQADKDRYIDGDPHKHSPIFRLVKAGTPVLWSKVVCENEIEAYYLQQLRETIGTLGISIPLSSSDESTSIFMVVTEENNADWNKQIPVLVRDFRQIGMILHRKALEIQGLSPPAIVLSTRHIDVLQLLATGMNEEQIGKFLNISVRSVKQYISETKIRLRSRSKVQAVATAISQGYLKTV